MKTSEPRKPKIPTGVWMLGFVSLFMDMSSELVHSLLPVYMATTLGASGLERTGGTAVGSRGCSGYVYRGCRICITDSYRNRFSAPQIHMSSDTSMHRMLRVDQESLAGRVLHY